LWNPSETFLGPKRTVDGLAQRFSYATLTDRKNLRSAPHERLHDAGVPLRAGPFAQDLLDATVGDGIAIGTARAHGVVGIRDGEDARHQWDVLANEPVGVALAVVALVMVEHPGEQAADRLEIRQDAVADDHMLLEVLEFLDGQGTGLPQNAIMYPDLADIMQQ